MAVFLIGLSGTNAKKCQMGYGHRQGIEVAPIQPQQMEECAALDHMKIMPQITACQVKNSK